MLRNQIKLDFGMVTEVLVDDGLSEDDFVFLRLNQDLADYDLGPDQLIAKVSIASRFDTLVVATKGKNWEFHKTDVDPWPSRLHGHFYDGGIKLDVITGRLYNRKRQDIGAVRDKELRRIQLALLGSKDLAGRTRECLGETRVAELLDGRAPT